MFFRQPTYIDSEECFDTYGLSAGQISSDISWLNSAILTTLADADIPEVHTANGDGIFAHENRKQSFANAGLDIQQLE